MNEASAIRTVRIEFEGRILQIEHEWISPERVDAPLLVFLHEGLGSLAMWRDYPKALCATGGFRGLVYSRPGYGHSTPRAPNEFWPVDFMHIQAREILPRFFAAVGLDVLKQPPVLLGHSDGGSIALIYATSFPSSLSALIVLAPHIFVEDVSITSIQKARDNFLRGDLSQRLQRYHADVNSAFWGWNDIWLNPQFYSWNIEALLPNISCPVLAIQGENDAYGTMAQVNNIKTAVPATKVLMLPNCGHSPHRDQADRVTESIINFAGLRFVRPASPSLTSEIQAD